MPGIIRRPSAGEMEKVRAFLGNETKNETKMRQLIYNGEGTEELVIKSKDWKGLEMEINSKKVCRQKGNEWCRVEGKRLFNISDTTEKFTTALYTTALLAFNFQLTIYNIM